MGRDPHLFLGEAALQLLPGRVAEASCIADGSQNCLGRSDVEAGATALLGCALEPGVPKPCHAAAAAAAGGCIAALRADRAHAIAAASSKALYPALHQEAQCWGAKSCNCTRMLHPHIKAQFTKERWRCLISPVANRTCKVLGRPVGHCGDAACPM